jgi:hypothetical protein
LASISVTSIPTAIAASHPAPLLGRLRQASSVVELDDLGLALVVGSQGDERLVEGEELVGAVGGDDAVVERDRPLAAAATGGAALAGVIDQDLAHRARGDGEDVGAVAPLRPLVRALEPEVRLGDEVGGAQRVARPLAAQVRRGRRPRGAGISRRGESSPCSAVAAPR